MTRQPPQSVADVAARHLAPVLLVKADGAGRLHVTHASDDAAAWWIVKGWRRLTRTERARWDAGDRGPWVPSNDQRGAGRTKAR